MRNNNLLKVFSGQQNKRYKLKGKAQTPFTFEGDNLININNYTSDRVVSSLNTITIKKGIYRRTNAWNLQLNNTIKNGLYSARFFGDNVPDEFAIFLTDDYQAKLSFKKDGRMANVLVDCNRIRIYMNNDIEIENDIVIKVILVKGNTIPTHFVPYRKPLTYSYPLSLHSNNGERDFVSMLIKGYTEKSGDNLLSANTPYKFTGENLYNQTYNYLQSGITYKFSKNKAIISGTTSVSGTTVFVNQGQSVKAFEANLVGKTISFRARLSSGNIPEGCSAIRITTLGINSVGQVITPANINITNDNQTPSLTIDIPNNVQRMYGFQIWFVGLNQAGVSIDCELEIELVLGGQENFDNFNHYRETFYNPTEGFSLNGKAGVEDALNTANGEHIVNFETYTFTGNEPLNWFINPYTAWAYISKNDFRRFFPNIKLPVNDSTIVNGLCDKMEVVKRTEIQALDIPLIAISKDGSINIYVPNSTSTRDTRQWLINNTPKFTYQIATTQTYQKRAKTLPQWVKHCFDNNGRELDMTLTPITLAEPVSDTYQNANGKITRKTNKIELSIQNSVAQEYTGYSYLLKFAQPLAKPNTPILCDLENTNIVQDSNYLIVEYHNPSFTTQEQYYNYFLYEKHELIYERATHDTETIRSVMINRQYTKCTDKNGVEVEMEKA